ncbi:MAG: hypothetical protein KAJ47_04125 [Candidatus Aenigmarchaeota archaeon]|nr:hypothetical protein [Candidatus Aenigmarchaeota archaeon]
MKIDNHLVNLKESLEEIKSAVRQGLVNKQRSLGFHTSAACVDMFEIFLHKNGYLPEDHVIKHEWFTSMNKMKEKVPYDFEDKEELLDLIRKVEIKRNNFCYGKKKDFDELVSLVEDFNNVKNKFAELGIDFEVEAYEEK